MRRSFLTVSLQGLAVLLLAGCSPSMINTPMDLDVSRYDPAVTRYPAAVGVYYPEDFFQNNFYHETESEQPLVLHSNPATASRRAMQLALTSTFAEVRILESLQEGAEAEDLAFVIVPSIVTMLSRLDVQTIRAGIFYQFDFYAEGKYFHAWQVYGVGKSNGPAEYTGPNTRRNEQEAILRSIAEETLDEVSREAVWDAISVFLAGFDQQAPLIARLPAPEKVVAQKVAGSETTLGLVGPIFDQAEVDTTQDLEECIIDGVEDNEVAVQILPLEALIEQLYPWLTRGNYPQSIEELEQIVQRPAVRARLQQLGIDYLLNWDGETIRDNFTGPLLTTAYGIIGYKTAKKHSFIQADLLDVADARVLHSFEATGDGTEAIIGLVYVALPIPADTEGEACEELALQLDDVVQAFAQEPVKSGEVSAAVAPEVQEAAVGQ